MSATNTSGDVALGTLEGTGRGWFTRDRLIDNAPTIVVLVVLVGLIAFVPNFTTQRNIVNIFVQASMLGFMAIGMAAVLIGGGMDLSMPAIMALGAILGGMAVRDLGAHWAVGAVIMVVFGVIAGAVNGFAVAYLGMIPFVVTLAMMTVVTGASIAVTNSVSVAGFPEEYYDVILARIVGIPLPVIVLLITTIVAVVFIRRSVFGRWLYAVGTNKKAALVSGIPAKRVIFGTYVLSGSMAGVTAVFLSARLGSASANMGNDGMVLDIISSAVVGGVSIYGGVGGPARAVIGALIITIISNSLNMMQVSYFTSLIIKGIVIIAFVAFDSLRRR